MDALPVHRSAAGKSPESHKLAQRDYAVGIGLLLLVVFLWTTSNFVTQDLFVGGYGKPFLITYLSTSTFSLYLLPFLIKSYIQRHHGGSDQTQGLGPSDSAEYEPLVNEDETPRDASPHRRSSDAPPESVSAALPRLTTRETARLASVFCPLWFLANWSLNVGLGLTSVASATILSSMSGFFTLIIGRIFRVDNFTMAKIGAVVTSSVGVILVSLSDSEDTPPSARPRPAPTSGRPLHPALQTGQHSIVGDCLALLSAVFYAVYVILLKVRIRSESRIDMQLFFGFVGLFNIVACWPIGVILHFTDVERFELPTSGRVVGALLANMAITLVSDYVYLIAMLKTTPLVVTIGLSLTMPLAVLGDIGLQHPVKAQVVLGAALVLVSFVVIGLEGARHRGA